MKRAHYYLNVISTGPFVFVRLPRGERIAWRKILRALTPIMRRAGLRQKDISCIDRYDADDQLADALVKVYEHSSRMKLPAFEFWDWDTASCSFVLHRDKVSA